MPLLETRGSGSASAYGFGSFSQDFASDAYSQYLQLALPLNSTIGTADVSHLIRKTGTRKLVYRYGSTQVNQAYISSNFSKFYGSSLLCTPYTDQRYIHTPNSSSLHLGTQDFTIEGWFYFTSTTVGYQALASHSGDTADQQNGWIIIMENNNTGPFFLATSGAGGWPISFSSNTVPTANTWNHLAVTRSGSVFRMFLNGTLVASQTTTTSIAAPSSRELRVGSYNFFPGGQRGFQGYIQDFRVYVGVAKYTTSFTPPDRIFTGANYVPPTDTLGISNLVAWWPLEKQAVVSDNYLEVISKETRDLQKIEDTINITNGADATIPSFVQFPANQNQHSYLKSVNSYNFTGSSGLTWSAWTKTPAGNNQWLISEGSVNSKYNIFYEPNLIKFRATGTDAIVYGTNIQDDTWKHLVYTYNISTRETKFYINGSLVQTGTSSVAASFNGEYILMGEHSSTFLESPRPTPSAAYQLMGGLAKVRLYNKVLSLAEVGTLYNNRLAN